MATLTPQHKSYSVYQPSGVEWLGKVPVHWAVARLKSHVANIADQTDDCGADEIYLTLENVESWTGKLLEVGNDASFDSRVKRFQVGDVLFGRLRPYLAKVTSPNCNGVCVSEFFVLRSRSDGFMPKYLEYLLLSKPIIDAINSATYGAKMPRADWQYMGGMKQPVPPLTEQTTIAAFLDCETAKIDALVSKKEHLIELLQEKRTALISRAVTKGLDPNAPMKDSGIEWLGDVPAHWEVRRLKTLCSMKSGDGISAMSIEPVGEYPVYGGNGLRGYTSRYNHDGAFVLIGRQGALCGNVYVARGKFWATEHAVVATLAFGHEIVWFSAILTAMNLNQYSFAAAQPGLAVERIMNLHLPLPPLAEQRAIATFLYQETAKLDSLVAKVHEAIKLLEEKRAALVSAAVTGKIDVREEAECT